MNAIEDAVGLVTEAVRHKLDARKSLHRWFYLNASRTHGLPLEEDKTPIDVNVNLNGFPEEEKPVVGHAEPDPTKQAPSPFEDIVPGEEVSSSVSVPRAEEPVEVPSEEPVKKKVPQWMKYVGAAAVASGITAGGTYLATRPEKVPVLVEEPVPVEEKEDSLYQMLEDRGFHLPKGGER